MTDDELLRLSAYADGETTPVERREIDAWLNREPAAQQALEAFASLDALAQSEPIPTVGWGAAEAGEADELFGLIRDRQAVIPSDMVERLKRCAESEEIPTPSTERFASVWKEIGLHSTARNEAAPAVHTEHWKRVWSGISTRTAAIQDVQGVPSQEMASPKKAPFFSTWMWAAGVGLAASIVLALGLPQAAPFDPGTQQTGPAVSMTSAGNSGAATLASSMSIPETQDDHYGVRVRFVEGSSDPVVSLYYKNPERTNALMGSDFNDGR